MTGEKCIFPFTVDGVTYTHCAFDRYETTPEYAIWCSTKVNDAGFHIGGNWGGCSEDCPLEGKNIYHFIVVVLTYVKNNLSIFRIYWTE